MKKVSIYGKDFQVEDEPADFWGWVEAGRWEPGTFKVFDACLKPETSFVDVGAWIGPTVLYASRLVRRGWALEPDPVAFDILQQNLAHNRVDNFQLFHEALMGRTGTCHMGASGLGCSVTRLSCQENQIEVPCTTLHDFIENHSIPDPLFIKIDVEGAELNILRDTLFLATRKPTLFVSFHQKWWEEAGLVIPQVEHELRFLKELYSHRTIVHHESNKPHDDMAPFSNSDILFSHKEVAL